MGRRARGALLSVLIALGTGAVVPPPARALIAWSLVATPLTATAGQVTTFTLTATNFDLLTDLGCLEVTLPASFQGVTAGAPVASNGRPWAAAVNGTNVAVFSTSGGGRLESGQVESVTFTISATPTAVGSAIWTSHANRQQNCSGADEPGLAPLAITIVPGAPPTAPPTPRPTASPTSPPPPTPPPTPASTPPPTPTPAPTSSASGAPGDPRSTASARPSSATSAAPTPSPRESPEDAPSATNGPRPSPDGPASTPAASQPSAGSTGSAPGGPGGPALNFDNRQLDLGAGVVGLGVGVEIWAVPAATIAVPGLLVLLWVALQAIGALAWIPAVRRLRGDDREGNRSR